MKRRVFSVILVIVMLCLAGCGDGKENNSTGTTAVVQNGCRVHFLSVGKADAILVQADGKAMLVDAGYQERADEVVSYLKAQGIVRLDYVVLTHGDKDHVGGMAKVLQSFDIGEVLLSPKKEKSDYYEEMVRVIEKQNIRCSVPAIGTEYSLGCATATVLAPGKKALAEGSDNDASLVVRLVYGTNSFLLMGDALSTTEKELVDSSYLIRADVLKVGYHGLSEATNKKFLKAVQPKYAVICCGQAMEDDDFGEPDKKVLQLLQDFHVTTYRTDTDGTVVFETDGTTLTCNLEAK